MLHRVSCWDDLHTKSQQDLQGKAGRKKPSISVMEVQLQGFQNGNGKNENLEKNTISLKTAALGKRKSAPLEPGLNSVRKGRNESKETGGGTKAYSSRYRKRKGGGGKFLKNQRSPQNYI